MYSGFWRRFAAYIIDTIVITVAVAAGAFALTMALGVFAAKSGRTNGLTAAMGLLVLLYYPAMLVIQWLYYAMQESSVAQATLGKRALSVKVIDAEGERITFGRATGRFFGKFLSGLVLAIGFIMAGFTEKKQALHDLLASTFVVHNEITREDLERGYSDAPPPGAGAVIAIVVVAGLGVPFVFGILAAIAIPAYQDYTIRAQVTEGLALAAPIKTRVVEWEAQNAHWPATERELLPEMPTGRYLDAMDVTNGTITLIFGNAANAKLRGLQLSLQPAFTESGGVVWRCGRARWSPQVRFMGREGQPGSEDSSLAGTTSGTTIPDKYLPSACRGGSGSGERTSPSYSG